jgi:DNA-binding beta-propeller fold protein YncE
VSVISGRTNTVVATIRVGLTPDGVAVNPKTGTIYAANSDDSTVSVIAPCRA